ncbi:MAG: SHOCT-like domain-containing protein [Planctomycetota bacterium]|jgi:hypothetical protein
MEQEVSFLSFILWLLGNLTFFVIALLVLRYAAKLKWLTAICLSVFAVTILLIFGIRFIPYPVPRIKGMVILLPAAVCAVIMVVEFVCWLIRSDHTSVNTAERERILKMVEEGKINSEEGTELLDAMGRSSALRCEKKFSRVDVVMLIGVSLVVLGFFLPWVYNQRGAYQSGPNAGAIGWAVLIIGIASVIPIFVTPKNFLYKISMLQIFLILIGTILVISILLHTGDRLCSGLIFCLAGFVVELFGAGIKFRRLAA